MNFQDLKAHFGSVAVAAERIGVVRQAVYEWERTGIPEGRQYQIEIITGGELKADVPADRTAPPEPPPLHAA